MQFPPWKVGELAKRTGLSVRTLHYYDEIGLLSPSHYTTAGHRLYTARDIIRLHKIKSLRQVGFSLEEVQSCLDQPDYSLLHIIQLHITRLREQIKVQQNLCTRLERVVEQLNETGEVSVDEFMHTLEVMSMVEKYYTPEQMAEINERAQTLGEERIRQAEMEWTQLLEQVRTEMSKGTDPQSEQVRQLAQRWMQLVNEFTGGNPGIERSLRTMYQQETTIHGMDTAEMRRMMEYISQASATA